LNLPKNTLKLMRKLLAMEYEPVVSKLPGFAVTDALLL
jgi:hypothetical protein